MFFRAPKPAPVEALHPLELADGRSVDVRWVRDPRARRLRLLVTDRGPRLTLPRGVSQRAATAFLHEHRDWLAMQLARRPAPPPPLQAGITATLPLRGADLPVAWCEGRYARVGVGENGIAFQLPARASAAQARAALRDFYLQQARADLGAWLPRYLPGLPRAPRSFGFRALSSIWGSLSPSGAVSLDLSLVLGRPEAFEYVLVHELCHLIQANHSRAFWREVEARWPQWRGERDYLRSAEGMALKSRLAALLGS
ncbi:M48 family metallopeptidase [Arenimonas composti]|uniref:YgjP-like metallopeptidase domain-containing protein n=1 Tax=Arenimonas composti TR7-09 = DSM 18010 TaxID=1121013 RepID=A0A091BCT9_9GAMM|nr:SprT family zinc-dependent metalloprotease [Arenimonas composti]KFN49551.1 hypothetical protein P873_10380 [Arenimonas composti TR7-09 = DSM 18010]